MMEYWNIGIMGNKKTMERWIIGIPEYWLTKEKVFFCLGSFLNPIFHHSTIPLFQFGRL